jgi:hypothetical protein
MRLAVAAFALLAALVVAESAAACSCVPVKPAKQLERSDGAFVGRLVAVKRIDDGDDIQSSGDPTDFTYRVGVVAKRGPGLRRGHRVTVRSTYGDSACGLSHRIGRLYGLFLQRRGDSWRSGACSEVSPKVLRRLAGRGSSQFGGEASGGPAESCA